jgi:hypothetical protein
VNTNPDRQLERGNLPQEKYQLAIICRGVGRKRTARDRRIPRETVSELALDNTDHGRQSVILSRREKIKRLTLEQGKKENLRNAA